MLAIKRQIGMAAMNQAARVREVTQEDGLRLDDGRYARVAISCLLRPQVGDRVALIELADGDLFVQAILEREPAQPARLEVVGASRVALSAHELALSAQESIEVIALREIEITAVTDRLNLNARHVAITATESIVQNAKHWLAHVGMYALQVRDLLRMHAQQTIVTAEKDVKVDAERISLG